MSDVHIIGIGSTPFGRHTALSLAHLVASAIGQALSDAKLTAAHVEAAFFANSTQGHFEGQHAIRGPILLRKLGFEAIPIVSLEAACAGGATAFHQAVAAIKAGDAEIALAVGAEKMIWPGERARMMAAFDSGWDVTDPAANLRELALLSPGVASDPSPDRSIFMDIYAAFCDYHMRRFGTRREQIAAAAAKNHAHAAGNPLAQHRQYLSIGDILSAKEVIWPLTVPMCAPLSDGAAAILIASSDAVRRLGLPLLRCPKVAATIVQVGAARDPDDLDRHISRLAALRAYNAASLGPADVSIAEVHDATSMGEIIQTEMLGFCPFGAGGAMAERGESARGGRLPVNVSGGLVSKGHPIAATGLGQLYELTLQLRGEAEGRQVPDARIGVAENGGGLIGFEEATCAVTVLARA